MMVEYWEPSERDKKRAEAARQQKAKINDVVCSAMERCVGNGSYKPSAEDLTRLEEWRKNRDK